MNKYKKILLNGVPLKGGSGLFSQFQCVIFSPDDRELIRGGPERRRILHRARDRVRRSMEGVTAHV